MTKFEERLTELVMSSETKVLPRELLMALMQFERSDEVIRPVVYALGSLVVDPKEAFSEDEEQTDTKRKN